MPASPARSRSPALVGLAALLGVIGTLAAACNSSDEPIFLGLAGPLSEARASSMRLGAELALVQINQEGGVRGRPLRLVMRDDSANADVAVRVAQSFRDDSRIVAVIGHLNSGPTLTAAPIYGGGAHPLVAISPSASSPEISGASPYVFRICPDDLAHGAQLAAWAREQMGITRVAILFENSTYGRGVRNSFRDNFTRRGGQIVSEDPYSASLPSFEPYLTRIRVRGNPDAVLIAGARQEAERIVRTMDSIGTRYPIMGGDGLSGIETSDLDVEGVLISSAYLPDLPGSRNEEFVSAYRRAYGDRSLDHRGAGAYDIVYLLAQAIDAVGTDRRAIRDYLASIGTRSARFEGVTGPIAFDANGNVTGKAVAIGVVRNRRLVAATPR